MRGGGVQQQCSRIGGARRCQRRCACGAACRVPGRHHQNPTACVVCALVGRAAATAASTWCGPANRRVGWALKVQRAVAAAAAADFAMTDSVSGGVSAPLTGASPLTATRTKTPNFCARAREGVTVAVALGGADHQVSFGRRLNNYAVVDRAMGGGSCFCCGRGPCVSGRRQSSLVERRVELRVGGRRHPHHVKRLDEGRHHRPFVDSRAAGDRYAHYVKGLMRGLHLPPSLRAASTAAASTHSSSAS